MSQMSYSLPQARRLGPLAPFARSDTYRALLFFLAVLPLGVVAFGAFVAGWSITLSLSFTPLVIPLLIGLRALVGGIAWANGGLARELLGATVDTPLTTPGPSIWRRSLGVLVDRAFWLQQAYSLLVWPIALLQLALLSQAGQLLALPIYYRWADEENLYGIFDVDTFGESLLFAAGGLVVLVVAVNLTRPLAALARRLATSMLRGDASRVMPTPAQLRARRLKSLKIVAALATGVSLLLTAIWALTSSGSFWPAWTIWLKASAVVPEPPT